MLKQCADSILLSLHTYKQAKLDISYHYMLEKLQLDLFMWIVVTPVQFNLHPQGMLTACLLMVYYGHGTMPISCCLSRLI